jgi:hypothetical protein
MSQVETISGTGWRLCLPAGFPAKEHKASGYESGAIARGFIGEGPVTVTIQVKHLDNGFNEWVRRVSGPWLEAEPPRRVSVPGARDAVRVDGYIEFDGLGARDDRERCVALYAKSGRSVVSVTIRSRPEDALDPELEPILDSLTLLA